MAIDDRDEQTRAQDRRIWKAMMGEQTPDDVMNASAFMLPQELAAFAVIIAASRDSAHPLPWPLEELGARKVQESLERSLSLEGRRQV